MYIMLNYVPTYVNLYLNLKSHYNHINSTIVLEHVS